MHWNYLYGTSFVAWFFGLHSLQVDIYMVLPQFFSYNTHIIVKLFEFIHIWNFFVKSKLFMTLEMTKLTWFKHWILSQSIFLSYLNRKLDQEKWWIQLTLLFHLNTIRPFFAFVSWICSCRKLQKKLHNLLLNPIVFIAAPLFLAIVF